MPDEPNEFTHARSAIDAVAGVCGVEANAFVEELIVFGSLEGRDSEPGAETIRGYLKKDRGLKYGFSLLLSEYIDAREDALKGQLPKALILALKGWVENPGNAVSRFQATPRHAAKPELIKAARGVYVIIHPDTNEPHLLQDILVLDAYGKGTGIGCATLLGFDLISRGTWCMVRNMIHVALCGRRSRGRSDIVSFAFTYEPDMSPLVGAFLGTSTGATVPAMAPLLAVPIPRREVSVNFIDKVLTSTDSRLKFLYHRLNSAMPLDAEITSLVKDLLNLGVSGHRESLAEGITVETTADKMAEVKRKYPKISSIVLPAVSKFVKVAIPD